MPALSSVAALPLAGLTLLAGRITLGLLYWLPVLPIFLKPFTAHFVRGGVLGGVLGVFNVFGEWCIFCVQRLRWCIVLLRGSC